LDSKPKLSLEAQEIVVAFKVLSTARTNNMIGYNPLSLVEIKAYVDLIGPPWLEMVVFVGLLLRMDSKYLSLINKKKP
jgi:hypothetical protein